MTSLKGKAIWLTGASSGIGAALAIELARRGARLALTARNSELLAKLSGEIRQAGGEALSVPGDVTNLESMRSVASQIERSFGQIDFAIANAGTHRETYPEKFDSAEYLGLMHTNFGGMLHVFEAALPSMLERSEGTLVGVASLAGYRGLPRAAAYGATKSAMIHFMEGIRSQLRARGVRVVTVNPGFVKTPLTDQNQFDMPFLITAERAAEHIADGLVSKAAVIAFPRLFAAFLALMRILPYGIYDVLVDRQWKKMERRLSSR